MTVIMLFKYILAIALAWALGPIIVLTIFLCVIVGGVGLLQTIERYKLRKKTK